MSESTTIHPYLSPLSTSCQRSGNWWRPTSWKVVSSPFSLSLSNTHHHSRHSHIQSFTSGSPWHQAKQSHDALAHKHTHTACEWGHARTATLPKQRDKPRHVTAKPQATAALERKQLGVCGMLGCFWLRRETKPIDKHCTAHEPWRHHDKFNSGTFRGFKRAPTVFFFSFIYSTLFLHQNIKTSVQWRHSADVIYSVTHCMHMMYLITSAIVSCLHSTCMFQSDVWMTWIRPYELGSDEGFVLLKESLFLWVL